MSHIERKMYCRLGVTESYLILFYYIENIAKKKLTPQQAKCKKGKIKWLYTTSGYYDKTVLKNNNIINDRMLDTNAASDTINYHSYFEKLIEVLKNSTHIEFTHIHKEIPIKPYITNFIDYIGGDKSYDEYDTIDNIYNFMRSKRILIINPYADLMKQQYVSGNVQKIYPSFPPIVDIITYENPYTFFNNGPDNNNLETLARIIENINKISTTFDCVIVSTGSYSGLIANHIYKEMQKDVYVVGGRLPIYFAIKTNRKYSIKNFNNDEKYWIDVPDKYKPYGYKKIENGCYW